MEYSTIMESTTVLFYSHLNRFRNNSSPRSLALGTPQRGSMNSGSIVA